MGNGLLLCFWAPVLPSFGGSCSCPVMAIGGGGIDDGMGPPHWSELLCNWSIRSP